METKQKQMEKRRRRANALKWMRDMFSAEQRPQLKKMFMSRPCADGLGVAHHALERNIFPRPGLLWWAATNLNFTKLVPAFVLRALIEEHPAYWECAFFVNPDYAHYALDISPDNIGFDEIIAIIQFGAPSAKLRVAKRIDFNRNTEAAYYFARVEDEQCLDYLVENMDLGSHCVKHGILYRIADNGNARHRLSVARALVDRSHSVPISTSEIGMIHALSKHLIEEYGSQEPDLLNILGYVKDETDNE
jgi:hypothetical protein